MNNDSRVDRGLFPMVATMITAGMITLTGLSTVMSGFSPDASFERRDCRPGVAKYLESESEVHRHHNERALRRACSGPHAFWQREVFDPWNGTESCAGAVADYVRARRAGAGGRDQEALRSTMADRCRFGIKRW